MVPLPEKSAIPLQERAHERPQKLDSSVALHFVDLVQMGTNKSDLELLKQTSQEKAVSKKIADGIERRRVDLDGEECNPLSNGCTDGSQDLDPLFAGKASRV